MFLNNFVVMMTFNRYNEVLEHEKSDDCIYSELSGEPIRAELEFLVVMLLGNFDAQVTLRR